MKHCETLGETLGTVLFDTRTFVSKRTVPNVSQCFTKCVLTNILLGTIISVSTKKARVIYGYGKNRTGAKGKDYGFQEWLKKYENEVDNFIVSGCVTDICVLQFTLSLRAYFNENNKDKRIIVPMDCVETYEVGSHDGNLMNLFALYNMHINGIEVAEKIN